MSSPSACDEPYLSHRNHRRIQCHSCVGNISTMQSSPSAITNFPHGSDNIYIRDGLICHTFGIIYTRDNETMACRDGQVTPSAELRLLRPAVTGVRSIRDPQAYSVRATPRALSCGSRMSAVFDHSFSSTVSYPGAWHVGGGSPMRVNSRRKNRDLAHSSRV